MKEDLLELFIKRKAKLLKLSTYYQKSDKLSKKYYSCFYYGISASIAIV